MPRYFFNLRWGHLSVCDPRGEECFGPAEAIEYAILAALHLMHEKRSLQRWAAWSVDIEDEARSQVATVPFAFTLKTELHSDGLTPSPSR